jgi:threonine dehydratase
MGNDLGLVDIADIRAAEARLAGVSIRTPLLSTPWIQGRADAELWLKPECLQPVGAFKIRGAYNALASLDPAARSHGVVTHSSGNHGRALAYAASLLEVPAVVVMPDVSPKVKIDAVAALGAEVQLVKPAEREASVARIAAEGGMTVIPPFDHPWIIAGQGTAGLEIMEDMPDADVVLVPVGGGGLASGVATAVKALRPETKVYGVEPELAADAKDSLESGELRTWPLERTYRTAADGLRTNLSQLTFAHLKERLDGILTVTEDEIAAAVGRLAREARVVAEPSGAVAPAAYLFHCEELPPGRTVALVSGGNLDPELLARLITA